MTYRPDIDLKIAHVLAEEAPVIGCCTIGLKEAVEIVEIIRRCEAAGFPFYGKAELRFIPAYEKQAAEEGAYAKRAGTELAENPFRVGTGRWYGWRSGWLRPGMFIGAET